MPESLVHPNHQQAAIAASGDGTVRQIAADIAAGWDWPTEYTGRVLRNDFVKRWQGRETEHRAAAEAERPAYRSAFVEGRPNEIGVYAGEVVGLIHQSMPAAEVVAQVMAEAETLLRSRAASLLS